MSVLTFSFICQPNSSIIPPPVTKLSLAPPRHGVRRDEKEGKARSKRGLIQLGYKLLGIPKETLHIQPPICGHCLAIWDFFTQPLVAVSAPLLRSPTSLQAIFLGRIIELLLYKHHLPSPQPKHAFLATSLGAMFMFKPVIFLHSLGRQAKSSTAFHLPGEGNHQSLDPIYSRRPRLTLHSLEAPLM